MPHKPTLQPKLCQKACKIKSIRILKYSFLSPKEEDFLQHDNLVDTLDLIKNKIFISRQLTGTETGIKASPQHGWCYEKHSPG